MGAATESESITFAAFPRRNRETGSPEEIRVEASDFNGRVYTHVRVWFQARDGDWRPTKQGIAIRENELDATIEALQEARKLVQAQGRATESAPRSGTPQRGYQAPPSRSQTPARRGTQPNRPHRPLLDRGRPPATIAGVDYPGRVQGPLPPREDQAFDEFAEPTR